MLQVFIAIILVMFLGLFVALSFPMQADEPKRHDTPARSQNTK